MKIIPKKNTTNEVPRRLGAKLAKLIAYDALGRIISVKDVMPNIHLCAGDIVSVTWTMKVEED